MIDRIIEFVIAVSLLLVVLAIAGSIVGRNEPTEPKPARSETETTFSISGVPVYRSYRSYRMESSYEAE